MLAAVVLKLRPVSAGRLPVSHGAFAHAAAMTVLRHLNPRLARALHEDQSRKPITVSPLSTQAPRQDYQMCLGPEDVCLWRLTGLSGEVSEELLRLSPDLLRGVWFGPDDAPIDLEVEACAREPEGADDPTAWAEDAGHTPYEALIARWRELPPPPTVTLDFLTPTTFRDGRHGVERPFPLPDLVFGCLLDQWNAHAPIPLGDLRDLAGHLVTLGRWQGETLRVELGSRRTVGFVGRFTYRFAEPVEALQRLIGMLGEYAFYAGVGWQTGQGMGQARVVSRPPRGSGT